MTVRKRLVDVLFVLAGVLIFLVVLTNGTFW